MRRILTPLTAAAVVVPATALAGGPAPPVARGPLTELPAAGRMLASGPGGTWIVAADGTRTRLGAFGCGQLVAARALRGGGRRAAPARRGPERGGALDRARARDGA